MQHSLEFVLFGFGAYLVIGLLFGIYFVWYGATRIDPNAEHGPLAFRLLILPGSIALWPLLLGRLRRGAGPPQERNAHRDAAAAGESAP